MLTHVKNGCATFETKGVQEHAFQAQQIRGNMILDPCNQRPQPPICRSQPNPYYYEPRTSYTSLVVAKTRRLSNASKVNTDDVIGMVIEH